MSTRTQRVNPDISVDSQIQNVTVKCNLESVMSFTDGFNPSDLARPAIMSTDRAQAPLSYRELRGFLQTASLFPICGVGTEDVVALLLSNGPTLAVALLLVMSNCVAAPLEPTLSEEELLDAFQQLRIKHAVKLRQQKVPSVSIIKAAQVAGVSLHEIAPLADKAGIFVCPVSPGDTGERDFAAPALGRSLGWCGSRPSTDPVLALRTSGTTSKPKVVPLSLQGLHAGAVSIGQTLGLAETDVCLNVLPFTHIAGISCSLLSTLFMGGSVVCAPSFNVELFVHWLGELEPTWYFGVPTIHKALLLHCGATAPRHSLRLIRNAGASLPHADAQKLRVLFGCSVIPSYGMTECAPIAQCREGYALDAPGTVGSPAAVSVCIADEGGRVLPYGEDGEICIRGRVVTAGYLNNDEANSACFFGEADTEGFRWFRTGDVGHLDTTGFLYVTGRSKELIKRGGEQVSPYEVEDLLAKHHAVDLAIVFGVPNDFWGEEVAACVVAASVRTGAGTPLLAAAVASQAAMGAARREEGLVGQPVQVDSISPADLVQFLVGQGLSPSKLPRQFVIVPSVDSIPKTTTGKYLRSSLAKHFNLVAVDNEAAIGLQNNQSSISEPFGEGVRNKVIRPDKSVLGLRFVIALWVVFMHFGANFPAVIRGFRASSLSMEMFFVIAGFQLSATVTRPITDWCEFYKNRIVAVYPLYLLSILFGLPGLLFSLYWPLGSAACVQIILAAVFGQIAWPWGGSGTHYEYLWFVSAYLFCLLLFPFFHQILHSHACFRCCCAGREPTDVCCAEPCTRYCCWPACGGGGLFLVLNAAVVGGLLARGWGLRANFFPPTWAGVFFQGCVLWQLFERNGQHPRGRSTHWGKVVDGLALLAVAVFWIGVPLGTVIMGKQQDRIMVDPADLPVAVLITFFATRFYHLLLPAVLLWVYALATGQGFLARCLRNDFLVKYLSPASYAMYLFHYPIALMLMMWFRGSYLPSSLPDVALGQWWLYFVVVFVTVLVSLFLQHVVNSRLTTCFLLCLESCGCRSNRRVKADQEETTLSQVTECIHGLTGAEVDEHTLLADSGFDSFGSAGLIGVLKARFPKMALTAVQVYQLKTVGDLVARIDDSTGTHDWKTI